MKYPSVFNIVAVSGKKCLAFCCFAFVLLFASCKKDSKPASELILGKWNVSSQYYYLEVDGKTSTKPIETPAGSYYDFKTDGTVDIKMGEPEASKYNYSFQSDNSILFSKAEGQTLLLKIISINSGKAVLHNDMNQGRMELSK
ncbi:MAG: hypothetical protein KF746_02675 [Chitinophagaceae bacterium]|nr:hypothetical protein [Chitinophagaceae bacterium]